MGFVEVLGVVEGEGSVNCAVKEGREGVGDRVAEEVGDFVEGVDGLGDVGLGAEFEGVGFDCLCGCLLGGGHFEYMCVCGVDAR